jgi:hypothetical protein
MAQESAPLSLNFLCVRGILRLLLQLANCTDEGGRISQISFGVGGVNGAPKVFPKLAEGIIGKEFKSGFLGGYRHGSIKGV